MDEHSQLQPLTNVACELHSRQCLCNNTAACDAAVTELTILPRKCACSRPRLAIAKCRQTSVTSGDSGVGLSLDPITERNDPADVDVEASCIRWSRAAICERQNGREARERECDCGRDDGPTDESNLIIQTVCEHHRPNAIEKMVSGSRESDPIVAGRSIHFGHGRMRTRSESGVADNVVVPARSLRHCQNSCITFQPRSPASAAFNRMEGDSQHKNFDNLKEVHADIRRRYRRLLRFTAFVLIVSSVSVAIAIIGYSNNKSTFFDTERKITELEDSLRQLRVPAVAPTASKSLPLALMSDKPHIHLQLNGALGTRGTPWNGQVLPWIKEVSGTSGLQYNSNSYTITVEEAGSYFLYNQIYIARMLGRGHVTRNLTNQTVMHTIYKIPFNFPSGDRPFKLAESVLTHCWNEDARTQIHASYLGIIVNVKRREQVLVGLESYHSQVDQLMPANTFFGMFKL